MVTQSYIDKLNSAQTQILKYAESYGLRPFRTVFELVDHDEMNAVASYGGFPTRYPHWRFGMEYEELQKGYTYGLQKIYELVINNDPCYAYLMKSNSLVDQKMVIAHVYGHSDFFRNNMWFSQTNRHMIDGIADHATRIRKYTDKYGKEIVENFIDTVLSLEYMIDYHSVYSPIKTRKTYQFEDDVHTTEVRRLHTTKGYLDRYINPPEFLDRQRKKIEEQLNKKKRFPEEPVKDILEFMIEFAPLENWQRDIISIVREESYYFAPQALTKIMNEGWACVEADTPIFTENGIIPMVDVVDNHAAMVFDGQSVQQIYDRNIIKDRPIVRIKTRRKFELGGSDNHRIMLADNETWKRLDELKVGDKVALAGNTGLWSKQLISIKWKNPKRMSLNDVLAEANISMRSYYRYKNGHQIKNQSILESVLKTYNSPQNASLSLSTANRKQIVVPEQLNDKLSAFIGYLVGDGHISRANRELGLTTGDFEQAVRFKELGEELFKIESVVIKDKNKWRVKFYSENLSDFLVQEFGLTTGKSAKFKKIPHAILRSPEVVVRAFLRAYFDCDGYAGKQGVILSTTSNSLASQTALLLLNYGILTTRNQNKQGCWHLNMMGKPAARYAELIGFNLKRKQDAVESYVNNHHYFKKERWYDEVISIEHTFGDVYDISVENTHRYAAAGFINHNSYWHAKTMTEKVLSDSEIIDFADHNAGVLGTSPGTINPYKLGVELFHDIEERWNKGKFGREYDECDDLVTKENWDLNLSLGREKIFDVRKIYNDITFIDEFLTKEFCIRHKLFVYQHNKVTNQYEISDRDFNNIKRNLLFRLTNMGQPIIAIVDGNHRNRAELLLKHYYDGNDLDLKEARDVLKNLYKIWQRPISLETSIDGNLQVWSYDGETHKEDLAP